MGITSQRERERERDNMYLILVLLVSPAFGRPSSDQLDVGGDISNLLESFISFSKETGEILDNSKLTEKVVESLLVAEQNLLEMEVDLKTLKYEVNELQIVGNYFPEYNTAKSYVRETRQELRLLAHRNVAEVRDLKILMEDPDIDAVLLKISLDKMNDLMIETIETLKEADKKYNKAVQIFKNLHSSIKSKHEQLEKLLTEDSSEHKTWVATVQQAAMEECKNETDKGFFGILKNKDEEILGLDLDDLLESNCPGRVENEISKFEAELQNLKTITERMLESGKYFDETIMEAIEILAGEIDQINSMTERAKDVSKNIDESPDEYLREYQTIATDFINGLDDLKNALDKFLAKPKDILLKN